MCEHDRRDNDIRYAIDAQFAGLRLTPALRMRVLRRARGEIKVKKKLSVGLVLAIVLMLAAVTAFAAITLNAYYEKAIEKEGQSGLIRDWSAADQVALVDWMVEAGAELDAAEVARLHDGSLTETEQGELAMGLIEAYYPARDGILTTVDIIAKEKGPIEYWSLEDKAWFSEMMQKYQPEEVASVNLLPTEADITQEQAIEIMYAYYEKEYGFKREDFDESKMTISFSEGTWDDGTGPERLKTWSMDLWRKNDPYPMGISILPNGEIKQASGPYVRTWHDDWVDLQLSDGFKTVEGKADFQREWSAFVQEREVAGKKIPENSRLLAYLSLGFALPPDGELSEQEAWQIAWDSMPAALDWPEERRAYYEPSMAAYCTDRAEGGYYWLIYGWKMDGNDLADLEKLHDAGQLPYMVIAKIEGATGELLELRAGKENETIYTK